MTQNLQHLRNTRTFLRRLPSLPGGITSETECLAFCAVVDYLDRSIADLAKKEQADMVEAGVEAALRDLAQDQQHD